MKQCRVDIVLSKKHKKFLYKLLMKKVESRNVIYFKLPRKKNLTHTKLISHKFDKVTHGQKMGVYTPMGSVNTHTHPSRCV